MMAKLPRLNYINIFFLFLSLVPYSNNQIDPFVAVFTSPAFHLEEARRLPRIQDSYLVALTTILWCTLLLLLLVAVSSGACSRSEACSFSTVFARFAKTHHCHHHLHCHLHHHSPTTQSAPNTLFEKSLARVRLGTQDVNPSLLFESERPARAGRMGLERCSPYFSFEIQMGHSNIKHLTSNLIYIYLISF